MIFKIPFTKCSKYTRIL